MAFVVDTTKFQAEGAVLNWNVVARRLGITTTALTAANLPTVLELRWTLKDELGLPTEPFTVWRRDKKLRGPKPIAAEILQFGVFFGTQLVDLKGSYSTVELDVSGSGGVVYAWVGNPWVNTTVAFAPIASGTNVIVSLSAPAIEGLLVSSGVTFNAIRGVSGDDFSAAAGWQKLEYVGLPVTKADWAAQGIGQHGVDQGMFGAFVDAISAAKQRLARGAPPIGWAPFIEAGLPAPAWSPPQPNALITDLNTAVLADLRAIAALPPATQAAKKIAKPIPPPENSSGQQMSEPGTTSQVAPLSSTYMASSVDCFNCLALGFGTAYAVTFSSTGAVPSALDFDYMITARWEKGPLGTGTPVEYAAIVPSPVQAIAPPVPSNIGQQLMGFLRPLVRDASWRASVRVTWDRPVPIPLFRARSFAFAQGGVTPATPVGLVMNRRSDGSPLAVAVNYFTSAQDPEPNRLSAVEREIPIPNDPGWRTLKYAAAHQDIYGQWSVWSTVVAAVTQPGVAQPRIVSAEFTFTNIPTPPNAKCTANLVIEFLWDWRLRTPETISFRGRLFAAPYHGAPPPDTTLPIGLQTQISVPPATTLSLNFAVLGPNGEPTSSWPGYIPQDHADALNEPGDQLVTFGNAQGAESRRYRVTIPGFELDFGPTGHVGLALWGQGQEAIPPKSNGAWSAEPSVISTSDPRPPVIAPDIVALSSLPDAAGESHAVLKWSASAGAAGYFVYETSETKLRKAVNAGEPDPALTLSQRLTQLRDIFDDKPAERRTQFTRRNSKVITGTSCDVTLPRGTTAIHVYVVLGVSAGQVEAAWPTSSTALYAFAVPRVPQPGSPTIEASAFQDTAANPNVYRSRLHITTRKGPRVKRIDIHRVRVDDAAKHVDTMGPPILSLDAMTPAWQVEQITDALGTTIAQATGTDTPSGSWKRVWYRAVAWSGDDLLRGTLAARSPASSSAWVVVPPSTPPDLSPITMQWPGTLPPDVLLLWSSAAVMNKTPVGSHRIAIRATRIGAPAAEPPIIAFDGTLAELDAAQPAGGSGAWRIDGTKPVQYRAIIRRADINDAVAISIRITDPLGRSSEQLATIDPGSILPAPVLQNFVLTSSVSPPGVMLTWESDTPLDPPVYQLSVTVSQPPLHVGPLLVRQPPIVLQLPLASVPLDEPGPVPPGVDPLRVRRMPGAGPTYAYYAFVRVAFTQIAVHLSSPDGRSAHYVQLP